MKLKKYAILALVTIGILFISGCVKQPKEEIKKVPKIDVETQENWDVPTQKRNDFGCFYSCDFFREGYPKQMCEDWNGGKQVYWPDDCTVMQYEPCIRLCEHEKNSTKKTAPYSSADMPPSAVSFPQSPADFLFHTRTPACADPGKEYNAQLVYARPSDGKDRYREASQTLRRWIANANGIVNNEAEKFGMTADIKVACEDDGITVLDVVLPKTSSQLNTHDGKTTEAIGVIMKGMGHDDTKTKYIVYYDSTADGCEGGKAICIGQSTLKDPDDKLSEDNIYNSGPDYSVIYDGGIAEIPQKYHTEVDMLAPIIMLHEYSHTLGAVQLSAPHSTGEGHCNDEPPQEKQGNDIMCKSDSPGTIFGDACKDSALSLHYDCNNDDYFNPKPEPGSYLATHWNLGSPLNKYIKFGYN